MARLLLVRHAKSDWDAGASDRRRPLNSRGRRQAPATGEWIAEHVDGIDLAVVSVATRAQQTWELVGAPLDVARRIDSEQAYTFDGQELLDVVLALPEDASTVVIVGHNPAMEELVSLVTGEYARMVTSAVAVIDLPDWDSAASGDGTLVFAGRPSS